MSPRDQPVLRARPRPQRAVADATRRKLLEAGRAVFARDGLSGAPIQAILDLAEVSPPALYHHFGSKNGLFLAVAEEVYEVFVSRLRTATQDVDSFSGAIRAIIEAGAQLHSDEPSLAPMAFAVQMEARRDTPLREELAATLGVFREFAEDLAIRAGSSGSDVRSRTLAIVAMLNGLSSLAVTLRDSTEFAGAAAALASVVITDGISS